MYTDIEWALSQGLTAVDLVPMLERLLQEATAEAGRINTTLHLTYAKRQLAEFLVHSQPFRAARLAQELVQENADDDRAHAALGLACLLMGHFNMAERAYRHALALTPHCPWYAHNLGHLLDVIMSRPHEALPLLRLSRTALPEDREIAISYAHALFATHDREEAWRQLLEATKGNHAEARTKMQRWTQKS